MLSRLFFKLNLFLCFAERTRQGDNEGHARPPRAGRGHRRRRQDRLQEGRIHLRCMLPTLRSGAFRMKNICKDSFELALPPVRTSKGM